MKIAAKDKKVKAKNDPKRTVAVLGGGAVMVVVLVSVLGPVTSSAPGPRTQAVTKAARGAAPPVKPSPTKEYGALSKRNVFQPLVTPPTRRGALGRFGKADAQGLGAAALLAPSALPAADGSKDPGAQAKTAKAKAGPEYVGTVTVNGSAVALIQDAKTGEGVYVKAGDPYNAARVVKVTPAMVLFETERGPVTLMKTSGTEPAKSRQQKGAPNGDMVASAGQVDPNAKAAAAPQPFAFDAQTVMQKLQGMSPQERRDAIQKFRDQLTPDQQNELRQMFRGGGGFQGGFPGGFRGFRRGG